MSEREGEREAKGCSLPGSNGRASDYENDALPTDPKELQHNSSPCSSTPNTLPWIIHTCSDTMRASDRPFTCLGYLFRQRGSRHGLFLEKDVIPPDRRRRPAGATRFDTGRLVCSIRFLSFPSKTCAERRSFHLVIVLKDAVSNTTEVHDLFVCST